MRPRRPHKLEVQLIAAFSLCMLALALGNALGTSWWINRVETKIFIEDSHHVVSALSERSRLALLFDSQELAAEALDTIEQNPDVDHAWILNADQILLAHSDDRSDNSGDRSDNSGDRSDTGQAGHVKPDFKNVTTATRDAIRIHKVVFESDNEPESGPASLTEQPLGLIHVQFNTKQLELVKQNIIVGVLVISALIALILMVLVLILSKRITRPLVQFTAEVETYEARKRIQTVDYESSREIQQLAIAFDTLMTRLNKNSKALQSSYERLLQEINSKEEAKKERNELQKRLLQSQKMESIGQLTSGIAHDFNNILGSILGFSQLASEMLEDEEDMEDIYEYVEEVRTAGHRAKQIVSQLLAFSRESHHAPKPMQISTEIKGVIDLLRPMLPASIEIENNISSDELANAIFDPTEFSQTIMNLCINARDAIGLSGTITLSLTRKTFDKEAHCSSCSEDIVGEYLVLAVKDSGTGIPADKIETIFEPFYTTKDVNCGSGLGLSMVHGVVHQNGGHIMVDSKQGEYTQFNLLLAKCEASQTEPEQNTRSTAPTETFPDEINVVLIDDDVQFLKFLQTALEESGCTVLSCTHAEDALSYLTKNHKIIDIVITDEIMPKMTGIEFIRAMSEAGLDTPVIVCTGYSKHNSADYMEYGYVKGLLEKPVGIEELLNTVIEITSSGHREEGGSR